MTEKRVYWEDGKDITRAYKKDVEWLGTLQYEKVGAHMHWCWYQRSGIRMSPGCLQEVRDKQKELWGKKNG